MLFNSLTETYNLPTLASYKQAVASSIMHLPPTVSQKAPSFFASTIRKAMANQIAYNIIEEVRAQEKAEQIKQAATQPIGEPAACLETTKN